MTDGRMKAWRLLRRSKDEPAAEDVESAEEQLPGDVSVPVPPPPPEDRGRTLRLAGWIAAVALAGVVAAWTAVASLGDLAGEKACTLATSTSEDQLRQAGATPVNKNRISECVEGLRAGKFDAVTTDAAILAGFVAKYPDELRAHDIGLATSERWGIATGRNRALRTLVNLALYRSYADPKDRRWEKAFDTYLAPLQKANGGQQVAVAEQPWIDEPDVRRWPWERDIS